MRYTVYLVESGSGCEYEVDSANDLAGCTEIVQLLDKRFEQWERNNFRPELDDSDPLAHYEGCDLYAHGDDDSCFFYNEGDEWEDNDPNPRSD